MKARRLFSVTNPGPLGITWALTPCRPRVAGVCTSAASFSPVSEYQSVANNRFSAFTVGPSTRVTSSTHSRPAAWFFGLL